jgi:hypothetical protein
VRGFSDYRRKRMAPQEEKREEGLGTDWWEASGCLDTCTTAGWWFPALVKTCE